MTKPIVRQREASVGASPFGTDTGKTSPGFGERTKTSDASATWVIQVGSFSEPRNALGLRDKLRAKGYRTFVRSFSESGKTTTRVFVGPMSRRDDALRVSKKLHGNLDIKGLVMRHSKKKY